MQFINTAKAALIARIVVAADNTRGAEFSGPVRLEHVLQEVTEVAEALEERDWAAAREEASDVAWFASQWLAQRDLIDRGAPLWWGQTAHLKFKERVHFWRGVGEVWDRAWRLSLERAGLEPWGVKLRVLPVDLRGGSNYANEDKARLALIRAWDRAYPGVEGDLKDAALDLGEWILRAHRSGEEVPADIHTDRWIRKPTPEWAVPKTPPEWTPRKVHQVEEATPSGPSWLRSTAVHNLLGHPLMEVAKMAGKPRLGYWIHRVTAPLGE